MEERIQMKLYPLLALTAALALAGCATTQGPEAAAPAAVSAQPPAVEAAAPAAVIPAGPLSAIKPSEVAGKTVAALEPPADMWARIRRGFAMPDLSTEHVRKQEQWYAARPDYIQRMTDRS